MVVYDKHRTSKGAYGVQGKHRTRKLCLWWSMMNIEQVRCVCGGL